MMSYAVFGVCFLLEQLALIESDLTYRIQISDDAKSLQYANQLEAFINPTGRKLARSTIPIASK
jgi:hypothetical protein